MGAEVQEALLLPVSSTNRTYLENLLKEKYGLSTTECIGQNLSNMAECVQAFTQYCPMVQKAHDSLQEASTHKASLELERGLQIETSLDPEKNLKYQEERKKSCQERQRSKDGSSSTYDAFAKKQCSSFKSDEECMGKFAQIYTSREISENREEEEFQSSLVSSASADTAQVKVSSAEARDHQAHARSAWESRTVSSSSYSDRQTAAVSGGQLPTPTPPAPLYPHSLEKRGMADETLQPNYALPLPSAVPFTATPVEAGKLAEEMLRQKTATERELEEIKSELASMSERPSPFRNDMEDKIKGLEELLAQQNKRLAEYQKMATSSGKTPDAATASETPAVPPPPTPSTTRTPSSGLFNDVNRAPISATPDLRSYGTSGQAASFSGGSQGLSQASLGRAEANALNSKYGVNVPENAQGKTIVLEPMESKGLPLVSATAEKNNLPLDVGPTQYAKFKQNDLESLEKIYDEQLKGMAGNIFKITVTTKGEKESLEFYAIKEKGRVIFQPVRKHKRTGLIEALGT